MCLAVNGDELSTLMDKPLIVNLALEELPGSLWNQIGLVWISGYAFDSLWLRTIMTLEELSWDFETSFITSNYLSFNSEYNSLMVQDQKLAILC